MQMNNDETANKHVKYANRCRAFEHKFGMTSDEFMQKFEAGTIGDDQDYFDWYAAKSGLDIWRKQHMHNKIQRESA